MEEGTQVTVDVSGAFSDPDGDALSYEAASDASSVTTASVSGSSVTVTGEAPGSATITVTATDPGDLSATQTFGVTVTPANRAPTASAAIPGPERGRGNAGDGRRFRGLLRSRWGRPELRGHLGRFERHHGECLRKQRHGDR